MKLNSLQFGKAISAALFVLLLIVVGMTKAIAQTYNYPMKGKQGFSLSEKTRDGLHVNYNLGQFTMNPIDNRGENMVEISISGIVLPNTEGYPNLPVESRLLAIPQGANARLNVINAESEIVRDVDVAPALRIQAENEEPEFNYIKNRDVYERNAFYPEQPFTIDRTSIRGVDAVAVSVSPFQYNPVTKELKVYTNIELSVSFEGGNGHFGDDRLRSPYWDPILATELMNYDQLPVVDYAARMQQWLRDDADGAEYLIITPNNNDWAEYANQLRDYRTRQGILTKVYRLDEMPASTTDEMKAWFHNAYNTWTIPPVAVLLFGDHNSNMNEGIPAEYTYHSSNYGNCITDNYYADPTGDNLPDMVFSRLVAANATEAQMMVSKQIEYEYSNPNMNASTYDHPITALGWQTERWFQICSEVVGGYWRNQGKHPVRINEIYAAPAPADIWSSESGSTAVVEYFGPNGLGYLPASPSELGGWTGGTGSQVVEAVNSGCMLLQHRDHGYAQGWGEPNFSNTNVNQMNNVGKLTFVNTINCQTGMFDYGYNCLIEAFMRRTYNGQNAGAVGCVGPTQVSYSFVNDVFTWGLYDQCDPDFIPDYGPYASYEGNWQPAFGNVAGKYFLQQCAWVYGYGAKEITYKMFTAHCDAFLRLYTQVPRTIEVTHTPAVVAGYGSVTVSAPEGCMISLVKANTIDGGWDILAVASATGVSQVIEFEPQVPPTVIHIIVTGQDYLRYEDTIEVVPAEGTFLALDSYTPQNAHVNQLTPFSMTFRNAGLDATTGITTVTVSSQDNRLTIVDGTGQFGVLGSNQAVTLADEFSFIIAQDVPDNTRFRINVTMTCGSDTWTGVATVTATQAVLNYVGMSWAEIFDPGETVTVTATFKNSGHYSATNAIAHIASTSQYVSFASNTYAVGTLEANAQVECTFNVIIASNCPETEQLPITFTLNADEGLVVEGSEIVKNTLVTVAANPNEGGMVSGAGKFVPGSTCTVTAIPNPGYVFLRWRVNGFVASGLSTYSFTVNTDAECVAEFEWVSNGVVIGDAAMANDRLPSYSYYNSSLTQQIYTADEIGTASEISSLAFFNSGPQKTRNYTIYMTHTNKSVFGSTNDWISVTEADEVFTGNVIFLSNNWTTIILDSPFTYDGTSNLAIIVDDNSGTWTSSPHLACRVFDADGNQAIRIYSDGTNYDPFNPSEYNGTLMSVKNQIFLGFPCSITATANPVEGGTVSGAGSYNVGATCTLTATPNNGYYFLNWTENGTVVSYDASYSFTVNNDKNLVANFVEGSLMCEIVFDLRDSYGDGWNGNSLVVDYGDGNSEQLTITSGSMASYSRLVETDSHINLSWISGSYTSECSFDVRFENGVPIYHSSGLGSSFQHELIINCVAAYAPHTITAVADPEEGGTVEGAGTFDGGTVITVTAIPNEGYSFCYWSENGQQVSTDAAYSFIVVDDRNLVAHFSLPLTISVTTNMAIGGSATGAGTYNYGNTCTLTATPNEGYLFLNWNINGEVVSCNATYSFAVTENAEIEAVFMLLEGTLIGSGEATNFYLPSYSYYKYTLSQQIYTPDEIGEARSIKAFSYYNAGHTETRSYDIYMVHTDKSTFNNDKDWITVTEADRVFSGSVTMTTGCWTTIVLDTSFVYNGTSNLAIVIDDNTGSYTSSPHMACRVFNTQGNQAIRVYSDGVNYDPYNPSEYNGTRYSVKNQIILGITPPTVTQTTNLISGWNWFSTYIEVDDPIEMLNVLKESLGENGLLIESSDYSTEFDGEEWFGDLDDVGIMNEEMYLILVSDDCTIELQGVLADPASHAIPIYPGWNRIGYPCSVEVKTVAALAGFQAEVGDILESPDGQMEFDGEEWFGDIDFMKPGRGYLYFSNSTEVKTLIYVSGGTKSR